MRKIIAIFTVMATALLAAPNAAEAADALRKFGFGVKAGTNVGFEVPINLTPTFRVSPLLTVFNNKTTTKAGGSETSQANSTMAVGVGVYSLMRTEGAYLMYVGGRVGAILGSATTDNGSGEVVVSGTDIFVAGAVGSEYFFNPRFSLGAEISLNVLLGGDKEADKGDDKVEQTSMLITTGGALNASFYF